MKKEQNSFELKFTSEADLDMEELRRDSSKRMIAKAVIKCLKFMIENLKHPSLNTHKYHELSGPNGEEIFESYAQNHTPGAYRIFWFYGPERKTITVVRISPHP